LVLTAAESRLASLSRVKDYKEETIVNLLQQVTEHATQIEYTLMSEFEIEGGQIDALWSYGGRKEQESEGKKGAPDDQKRVYWRSTMIDIDSRP
jgi:hypothetical protein